METLLDKSRVKDFILAGNAMITLESGVTGRRFTYQIKQQVTYSNFYGVRLITGPDAKKNWKFLGTILAKPFRFDLFPRVERDNYSVKALDFLISHIDSLPEKLNVYNAGRCCYCGRELTTPESIKRGYGVRCAKAHNLPYDEVEDESES